MSRGSDYREATTNSISEHSGEYGLQRLLTPNAFAKEPTVHRIQDLKVDHISFLYGEVDWMDASGGTVLVLILLSVRIAVTVLVTRTT